METFYFPNESNFEKLHRAEVIAFIKEYLSVPSMKDVGDTLEGIQKKYDFETEMNKKRIWIEAKLVKRPYRKICLEYMNSSLNDPTNKQPNTAGWMANKNGSRADLLFYLFNDEGRIIGQAYNLRALKEWFWPLHNAGKFERSHSLNTSWKTGKQYNTHCDLVPLSDIPLQAIVSRKDIATFKPKRKAKVLAFA